nr:LINE-1 reverse transcriptase isogeny [Tanacetum cinerariifolium]
RDKVTLWWSFGRWAKPSSGLSKGRRPGLLLKLDFQKSYDSVSHEFVFEVMQAVGFGGRFIKWIKAGITNVYISILVNGSPTKETIMHRGLRQGDPLSPFLFLQVAEVLSRMLQSAQVKG